MAERCEICGGADTCPLRDLSTASVVLTAEAAHTHYGPDSPGCGGACDARPPCEGFEGRGFHGHRTVIVLARDGFEVRYTGSKGEGRMRAHFGVSGLWVGQCRYAFYVREPAAASALTYRAFAALRKTT